MQIAARINQEQTISKDLTLWNQQGSQVLRGQTLVLPVGNTFLYVDPIYIQATEASMTQLKKVVRAVQRTPAPPRPPRRGRDLRRLRLPPTRASRACAATCAATAIWPPKANG